MGREVLLKNTIELERLSLVIMITNERGGGGADGAICPKPIGFGPSLFMKSKFVYTTS
jgi:hypothetical protein